MEQLLVARIDQAGDGIRRNLIYRLGNRMSGGDTHKQCHEECLYPIQKTTIFHGNILLHGELREVMKTNSREMMKCPQTNGLSVIAE